MLDQLGRIEAEVGQVLSETDKREALVAHHQEALYEAQVRCTLPGGVMGVWRAALAACTVHGAGREPCAAWGPAAWLALIPVHAGAGVLACFVHWGFTMVCTAHGQQAEHVAGNRRR